MKKIPFLLPALIVSLGLTTVGRVTAQSFINLHNFNGVTDGGLPYAGLAVSGNTLYGTTFYGSDNTGTIFAVNTDGTGFTNLYSFANGGGANPEGGLIVSDGALYGTTANGFNAGNVFSLSTNGANFANLHRFVGGAGDGAQPYAGVILSSNILYGTTTQGGVSDGGTVYALNLAGAGVSVLHSFTGGGGGGDGQSPECLLVLSGNTLYGTTYEGASAMGTVFAVNTDGSGFRVLHTFTGGTNGADPQAGVTLWGNTLYGTTINGGRNGDGIVFKINTDGSGFADLHDFVGPDTDGYQPVGGVVMTGAALYGTTIQGGTGNAGVVYRVNTDGTGYTNLYSFTALQSGTNSDGAYPQSGLILVGNTLYGTASHGGTSGDGTVFSLTLPPVIVPTTIDAASRYAYGANFGWVDWQGDTAHGAVIGEYICSGYIYSANVGWINLGGGAPANGVYYQNASATDFGVNQDGLGNLRGYAYGANIGWVNFENTGAPAVDLQTGLFSGYAYSANAGWISLGNASASVRTDVIMPGLDSTGDGIPDAWALLNFGTININPNADPYNTGMTLLEDYLAGTNPNNPASALRITSVGNGTVMPGFTTLQWQSEPTRAYAVQYRATLDDVSSWTDVAEFGVGANNATFNAPQTNSSGTIAFAPSAL